MFICQDYDYCVVSMSTSMFDESCEMYSDIRLRWNKTNAMLQESRCVTRVCGARARNKMAPPYHIFAKRLTPWKLAWRKVTRKKNKKTFHTCFNNNTRPVQIDKSWTFLWAYVFIGPITDLFVFGIPNDWSYIFLTWHNFAPWKWHPWQVPHPPPPLCHSYATARDFHNLFASYAQLCVLQMLHIDFSMFIGE